jgi:MFS transporter, FSR family, fosmidomycin resistance protein
MATAHLFLEAGFNFLPVTYALLIPKLGLTYGQIGTLVLLMTISGTITQPLFGWLSDRGDPRKIVVISVVWGGVLMGFVGFMPTFGLLAGLLILAAVGSAAFHPPAAALSAFTETQQRGRAMSIFSVGGNLGSAISPAFMGVALAVAGLSATGILIPLAALTGLVLARRLKKVSLTTRPISTDERPHTSLRIGSIIALMAIIMTVASRSYFQQSLETFLPQWLLTEGHSLSIAGAALSIMMVAVGIGSLFGGSLSDRFGRLPVIAVSLCGMIAGQWILMQLSGGLQVAAIVLIGLMIGASYPVTIVLAQEAWPQRIGFASAMVMGLGWLPAGLGAFVVGQIADSRTLTAGLESLLLIPLVGIAAVAIYYLVSRRMRTNERLLS